MHVKVVSLIRWSLFVFLFYCNFFLVLDCYSMLMFRCTYVSNFYISKLLGSWAFSFLNLWTVELLSVWTFELSNFRIFKLWNSWRFRAILLFLFLSNRFNILKFFSFRVWELLSSAKQNPGPLNSKAASRFNFTF